MSKAEKLCFLEAVSFQILFLEKEGGRGKRDRETISERSEMNSLFHNQRTRKQKIPGWSSKLHCHQCTQENRNLPRAVLSNMAGTSSRWLFQFQFITMKAPVPKSMAIFPVLSSYMWRVASLLDSIDTKPFPSL